MSPPVKISSTVLSLASKFQQGVPEAAIKISAGAHSLRSQAEVSLSSSFGELVSSGQAAGTKTLPYGGE
jgi:hypothetical protein